MNLSYKSIYIKITGRFVFTTTIKRQTIFIKEEVKYTSSNMSVWWTILIAMIF